jgi:hypothetical protein
MSVMPKRDLFAPDPIKKNRKKKLFRFTQIPYKTEWKDKNGSWAVKYGIVKIDGRE